MLQKKRLDIRGLLVGKLQLVGPSKRGGDLVGVALRLEVSPCAEETLNLVKHHLYPK